MYENVKRGGKKLGIAAIVVIVVLALVIGGAISLGVRTFHINLFHRRDARFSDLFSHFGRLWRGIRMQIVVSFFILLWSLLLIIPGIIATYRYSMVPFLMAEFPDLGVRDAMRESKRLMDGNKWKLFCLQFSYIGWAALSLLSMGIGNLWLVPYQYAGETAFYMYVTGRAGLRYAPEVIQGPEF